MAKHPSLDVIMGIAPKHGDDEDDMEGDDKKKPSHEDNAEAIADATDEIFDALKMHDKERFGMALDAFFDLKKHAPESEDEEVDADMPEADEDEDEDDDVLHA